MMMAVAILFVASSGILALFGLAVMHNSALGDHGTRTTEYAQDKMEQLLTTTFSDTTTDFTQNPPATGTCCGLSAGGSVTPASPATGYVDYVSTNGTPSSSSTGAAYIREWMITNDSNSPTQIKTITVMVKQISATTGPIVPSTMLISQKCSTDN
jgi:hypothetical protein